MLWIGTCTIYEYQEVTDPRTHQTTSTEVAVVTDEPCRLSYQSEKSTNVNTGVPEVVQITRLFISPTITIKAGSKLVVTQHGVTNTYKRTSEPLVYTNHQEVVVELDKDV